MDEAVQLFGQHVEHEMSKEKSEFQRKVRFNELLDIKTPPKKVNLSRLASIPGVVIHQGKKKDVS